ncbi:hypothetical protein COB80_00340 [Candidatus Kaiserbacteria bacterium]|nr:MAG: hypothetical protein COB80_00340 [Candidatus Kaiserbacteria bacterium]
MSDQEMDTMSVKDWEHYLSNRRHTDEIVYHGGGNYLSMKLRRLTDEPNCSIIYSKIVQATLNIWLTVDSIERDSWDGNPIHLVAEAAFVGDDYIFVEALGKDYCRLWKESPRPHTNTHRYIAFNSAGQLPVTKAEVGLMFELSDDWSHVAASIASDKGWNDEAGIMLQAMFKKEVKLNYWQIVVLVDKRKFPRENGILWLKALGHGDRPAVARWESEITSSS